jgi:putative SOS response-associated peptidase YedK
MPIIRPAGNGRELLLACWGLVPFWLKPNQLGKQTYSTINARDDRIQTAATYREPFKKRRCLVPARRASSRTGCVARLSSQPA